MRRVVSSQQRGEGNAFQGSTANTDSESVRRKRAVAERTGRPLRHHAVHAEQYRQRKKQLHYHSDRTEDMPGTGHGAAGVL